jgi:outer membrane protein assembly factor BamB
MLESKRIKENSIVPRQERYKWLLIYLTAYSLARISVCSADTNTFLWTYQLPFSSDSTPALTADGSAVLGCGGHTSDTNGFLLSISKLGKLNWQLPLGPITASPVIAGDGTIYVGSTLGSFFSVSQQGVLNWALTTTTNSDDGSTVGNLCSSAALATDGTLYVVAVGRGLHAITKEGHLKWLFPLPGDVTGYFSISSPAIGPDGTIYVGSSDQKIYAVCPNGTERWSFSTGGAIAASPCITSDGTVLMPSMDRNLYAFSAAGSKRWQYDTIASRFAGNMESTCVIGADGTIYATSFGSADAVHAIDPAGHLRWWAALLGIPIASPIVTTDNRITLLSYGDTRLMSLALDGTNPNFETLNSFIASPVMSDGSPAYMYLVGQNTVYCRVSTNNLAPSAWPLFRRNAANWARANQCSLSAAIAQGSVRLALNVETNRVYVLEQSPDLAEWTELRQINPSRDSLAFNMPNAAPREFFRLRVK